jgi:hypothetical protein
MLQAAAAEDPGDSLFLVTLSRGGDARSWRLFRALGFQECGNPSWSGEIEIREPGKLRSTPPERTVTWMGGRSAVPSADLAGAYNDVFGEGCAILSAREIQTILSSPDFLPELSAFSREGRSGPVTGFLLTSRRGNDTVHIDCIGIRKAWRGRGYLERTFRVLCEKAGAAGIRRCTFVTGRPEVVRFAERRFGARLVNELVWLLRQDECRAVRRDERRSHTNEADDDPKT